MPTLRELFNKMEELEKRVQSVESENKSLKNLIYGDKIPTPQEINPNSIGVRNTNVESGFDFKRKSDR